MTFRLFQLENIVNWCSTCEELASEREKASRAFFGDDDPRPVNYWPGAGEHTSKQRRFLGWFTLGYTLEDGRKPGRPPRRKCTADVPWKRPIGLCKERATSQHSTALVVHYLSALYMGLKEINKKESKGPDYRVVPAVWPPIVEKEKFEKVQRLMSANGRSNHNGSRPVRHTYALGKLLRCGRCRGSMVGRSGTGKLKMIYYYYVCEDCRPSAIMGHIRG